MYFLHKTKQGKSIESPEPKFPNSEDATDQIPPQTDGGDSVFYASSVESVRVVPGDAGRAKDPEDEGRNEFEKDLPFRYGTASMLTCS